jgi:hypothetical protein
MKLYELESEMAKLEYERSLMNQEDEDLEMYDPNDPNSIEFRINQIKKEMFEINLRSKKVDFNQELLKCISSWMINEGKTPRKITSISRGALIQYIYNVFTSLKSKLSKNCNSLVICHRISVLCERENLYLQLLRENTHILKAAPQDGREMPMSYYSSDIYLNQLHYVEMMEHCHNQDWKRMCIAANRYFNTSLEGLAFKDSMLLICNCLLLFLSSMIIYKKKIQVPSLIHDQIFYRNSTIQSFSATSWSDWSIFYNMLDHYIYLIEYIYKRQHYLERRYRINMIVEVYFTLLVNHPKNYHEELTDYIEKLKRICNILMEYNLGDISSSCEGYINLSDYKRATLEKFIDGQIRYYNLKLKDVIIIESKPIDQDYLDEIRDKQAALLGIEMKAARFISMYLPRYRKDVFERLIKGHSRFIFLTEMMNRADVDNFYYISRSRFIMFQWNDWKLYIKKLDSFTEILSRLYRSRYSAKFKDIDLVKILPKIREITNVISDFIITILNCRNEIKLNEEKVRVDKILANIQMSEFNHKLKKAEKSHKGEWKENWERFIRSIKPTIKT